MDTVDLLNDSDADGICIADVEDCVEVSETADIDSDAEFLCGVCGESELDQDNHALEVSVAGSPLFTDDDRRSGPAEQDHQSQGGPGESKHQEYENIDDEFTPEAIERACSNHARFSGIPREAVIAELILERAPSLGINGWADSSRGP